LAEATSQHPFEVLRIFSPCHGVDERALAFLQHFATGLRRHLGKSDPYLFVHGFFTRDSSPHYAHQRRVRDPRAVATTVHAGALPIITVVEYRGTNFTPIRAHLIALRFRGREFPIGVPGEPRSLR
jgi:hypothetical protein